MPWFKRHDGFTVKVPDNFEDTIERLHREGWILIPDPTAVVASSEPGHERAATPQVALTPPPAERAVPSPAPDDTLESPAKREPARTATKTTRKPVAIRATAKVGGRKPGSGQLSPQMRAKQWPKVSK